MSNRVVHTFNPMTRAALFVGGVSALFACARSDDDYASLAPDPSSHSLAAQRAIDSAQAAHRASLPGAVQDVGSAAPSAPLGEAVAAPSAATATAQPEGNNPPGGMGARPSTGMAMGGPPTGFARMLGQPPQGGSANAAGALPAAIGAPHLYHQGAASFFLDQGGAIGLTSEQQKSLTALREKALMAYATTQRKIDQGEQDLWALSSSEAPDIGAIGAAITEIGRLGVQQRMDFIRALGSAVSVLTDSQRKAAATLNPAMPSSTGSPPMKMGSDSTDAGMPMGGGDGEMGSSGDGGMAPPGMGHGRMPMPAMPKAPMVPMRGMGDAGSSGGMGHM